MESMCRKSEKSARWREMWGTCLLIVDDDLREIRWRDESRRLLNQLMPEALVDDVISMIPGPL